MIKVVPKIILMLELFSSGEELSFAEVTRRSGLTRSNVSHLLNSLCENGLLVRTGYGSYRRGERLLQLCGTTAPCYKLKEIAERCADNMIGWFNELAVIGLRHQGHRLTLVKRKPLKNLQVEQGGNERHYQADWYATACGRILLAFSSEEAIAEVVRRCGLPTRHIWPQAVTMPKLLAELENIRQNKSVTLSVDDEIKAIGVPAYDAAGEAVLSVSTAFPVFSCKLSDQEIIEKLTYAAESMSKEMTVNGIIIADLNIQPLIRN